MPDLTVESLCNRGHAKNRAIRLAAEDKRSSTHSGVDYSSILRVITKVRLGA